MYVVERRKGRIGVAEDFGVEEFEFAEDFGVEEFEFAEDFEVEEFDDAEDFRNQNRLLAKQL
jgi:hypothetical protein